MAGRARGRTWRVGTRLARIGRSLRGEAQQRFVRAGTRLELAQRLRLDRVRRLLRRRHEIVPRPVGGGRGGNGGRYRPLVCFVPLVDFQIVDEAVQFRDALVQIVALLRRRFDAAQILQEAADIESVGQAGHLRILVVPRVSFDGAGAGVDVGGGTRRCHFNTSPTFAQRLAVRFNPQTRLRLGAQVQLHLLQLRIRVVEAQFRFGAVALGTPTEGGHTALHRHRADDGVLRRRFAVVRRRPGAYGSRTGGHALLGYLQVIQVARLVVVQLAAETTGRERRLLIARTIARSAREMRRKKSI